MARFRRSRLDWFFYEPYVSRDMWEGLRPRWREAIYLRMCGYGERQIGDIMGITHRTVWGYRTYAYRRWLEDRAKNGRSSERTQVDIRKEWKEWVDNGAQIQSPSRKNP